MTDFDTQPLHPMCYSVLYAIQTVFKEHQEVGVALFYAYCYLFLDL